MTTSGRLREMVEEVDRISSDHSVGLIEAVVVYCEKHGLEVEAVGQAIRSHPNFKSRLQLEAEDLHFMKKKGRRLPDG